MDTVLGRVAIRRAWYHCDQCHHGLAPRDAQLGVAGCTMSPGLRKMIARAAAAVPFAAAARLISELAGLVLTGRRAGRRAEAARLAELDDGDIEAICAAARAFPLAGKKAGDLQMALGYFEHNAHRMCYAHYRKLGMFVRSGAVEAGCKAIVAQCCKLSGMRWTLAGAYGILTLRCLNASDRWEETWTHPGQAGAGAA